MIAKALLLLQRSRYDLAEQELRQSLAENPEDAQAHALLAYSLAEQDKLQEAEDSARQAVQLAPDDPYCHYYMGVVKVQKDDLAGARRAAEEAIRLDPENSDYHGLRALIYLGAQRWQEALDAANEGLRHDPTHQNCLNHRAMALVKLNRPEEAQQTIGRALQENPENEQTHANLGWAYLHKGQHQKALEHFSEALRLDPNFDYARQGLVEALKARYFLYRWLLQFFLWMSRLSPGVRGGLIIGAYVLVRVLRGMTRQHPEVAPLILPIVSFYGLFVLLTWIIDPLFNLALRCNKYGKHALSSKQRLNSSIFGLLLLATIVAALCGAVTGLLIFFLLALNLGLLILPATHVLKDDEKINRGSLAFVLGMALFASAAVASLFAGSKEAAFAFSTVNFFGACAFTWFSALRGLQRPSV
jgi:tetratricopeptide (TPR) repeat protein